MERKQAIPVEGEKVVLEQKPNHVFEILNSVFQCRRCASFSEECIVLPCGHLVCSKHSSEDVQKLGFEEQMKRASERKFLYPDMSVGDLVMDDCSQCKEKTWNQPSTINYDEKQERICLFKLCYLFTNVQPSCSDCTNETPFTSICLDCLVPVCKNHQVVHEKTKKSSKNKQGHECITKVEFINKFSDIVKSVISKREKVIGEVFPNVYTVDQWKLEIIQLTNAINKRESDTDYLIRKMNNTIQKTKDEFSTLKKLIEDKENEIVSSLKEKYEEQIEKSKERSSKLKTLKHQAQKAKALTYGLEEIGFMNGSNIEKIIQNESSQTIQESSLICNSSDHPFLFEFEIPFSQWFDHISKLKVHSYY